MSNFLPNRVKNIRGWIPESDVDGIDLPKETFVSETENIVYENGFFRNEKKPRTHVIPFTIQPDEELLDVTNFYHTDRGRVWVYVLWNTTDDDLYLYVVDGSGFADYVTLAKGVPIWGNKAEFVYSSEVNFAEFNDSLKINLDGGEVRITDSTDFIFREWQTGAYSLDYVDKEYDYIPGTDEWIRESGWYFSIRWLGSSYHNIYDELFFGEEADEWYGVSRVKIESSEMTETDFGTTYGQLTLDGLNLATSTHVTSITGGITYPAPSYISMPAGNSFVIPNISALDFAKLAFVSGSGGSIGDTVSVQIVNWEGDVVYDYTYTSDGATVVNTRKLNTNIFGKTNNVTGRYTMTVSTDSGNASTIVLAWMQLYPVASYVILSEFESEGQRANILHHEEDFTFVDQPYIAVANPFPIFQSDSAGINPPTFRAIMSVVDFDIRDNPEKWSFYIKFDNEVIYYKIKVTNVSYISSTDTIDTVLQNTLEFNITLFETPVEVEVLGFDYGLGASVITFPIIDDVIGHNVKNEVYYKNRSYIVNGDKFIYMSHISGNARLQADSFPYSKLVEFGYIYGDNSDDQLIAVAVSPLDELLVLSGMSGLVYTIQSSQTSVYRKIKATNGNVGIGAPNSLVRSISGKPLAEIIPWADDKGIYIYGGGVAQPKNVVEGQLDNYWKSFFNTSIIGAYNPMRNEALFISGDLAIVLDLGTLTWRKIRFTTQVSKFIGIIDYKPYFLMDDDTIIYLDDSHSNQSFLSGALVTHYQTNYAIDDRGNFIPLGEMTDKILQEFYVSMHGLGYKTGTPIGIDYDVIADNNTITPKVTFSGLSLFQKVKAPLLVRYRMVKIRIVLSNTNFSVKEVGYTFNVKNTIMTDIPDGEGTGFGNNFGNDFGVYL